MSLAQKYRKSLSKQWRMRFKTIHPDDRDYDGVVTHIKRSFIVLAYQYDFEFDGFIVFPKKGIKGYRDDKHEKCSNEIIRQNGAMKQLRPPRWLDTCDSIPQVLAEIKRRGIWPAIEILDKKGTVSIFYIGPITRLLENAFFLKCYDAMGKWEKAYELNYNEIFRIDINSRYCKHFNRYVKAKSRGAGRRQSHA